MSENVCFCYGRAIGGKKWAKSWNQVLKKSLKTADFKCPPYCPVEVESRLALIAAICVTLPLCHSASNDHFRLRFNRSASAITTSNYEFATDRISVGSVSESGQTGQTSGVLTWGGCNTTAGNSTSGIEITLYNPLSTTQYKCAVVHNCTYDGSAWSDNTVSSRLYDSTAALSGITIITSGGENITLTGYTN